MSEMLEAALEYAMRGWSVLPLNFRPDSGFVAGKMALTVRHRQNTRSACLFRA